MLDSSKLQFEKDAKNLRTEVSRLTEENTKMNADVGSPSELSEDGYATAVEDPVVSLIGGLEKDRNISMDKENSARSDKTANENSKSAELKKLYGDDGEGGIWGAIKGRQQQCDYWMINGPTRQDAIDSELKALTEAKIVLENDKELGMAEGDQATLEAREAGADAHQHSEKYSK